MKQLLFVLALFFIFPLASADLITPGYHPIEVRNVITNIADFPDYVFVTKGGLGGSMCQIKVIREDGEIPGAYKLCSLSVYAIKKSEFNETNLIIVPEKLRNLNESERQEYDKFIENYFNGPNVQEVISNVRTYHEVKDSSTQTEILNEYTINLSQVSDKPTDKVIQRNYNIYLYPLISALALLIILYIIFSRKEEIK